MNLTEFLTMSDYWHVGYSAGLVGLKFDAVVSGLTLEPHQIDSLRKGYEYGLEDRMLYESDMNLGVDSADKSDVSDIPF